MPCSCQDLFCEKAKEEELGGTFRSKQESTLKGEGLELSPEEETSEIEYGFLETPEETNLAT